MNEVSLEKDVKHDVDEHHQSTNKLISSEAEVEDLADEIASGYLEYFKIDISEQKKKSEESIEECLIHLEEVCSVLDSYRQNSDDLGDIVEQISSKNDSLNKLYNQVDALEQYIFETNKSLDQLESLMKELDNHKRNKANKIKQIINLLPRFSLDNMPRLNLLNSFSSFIEEPGPSSLDDRFPSSATSNTANSISDILVKVSTIENSINESTICLNERLVEKSMDTLNEDKIFSDQHNNLTTLNSESPEQVDGSWQELL